MKTASVIRSSATGRRSLSGRLKILLLVLAFAIVAGTLWYTHELVQALSKKETDAADLYAKSFEYIANGKAGEGDYNFLFTEIIDAIDFPVVMTDRNNEPSYPYTSGVKNVFLDTTLSREEQRFYLKNVVDALDRSHTPIKIAYQDTIILSYLHYGESSLVLQLRRLPYIELGVAALFVLIGYISFSYVRRSEQSSVWVGMARETAHQLGTPISSMLGWVELLKDQFHEDASATGTLLDMENDLHRLQKIADRFSKIGSKPDLHPENVVEVLNEVQKYFQRRIPQMGKKVRLTLDAPPDIHARINRELFEWVIENLTKNALDAIESGEGTIAMTVSERGAHIYIDVSDSGKGIDSKHKKDIFRPGFSTKKRGWGLGLSLAKRIIESYHGGKLTLKESKPGFKTTFRIRLDT